MVIAEHVQCRSMYVDTGFITKSTRNRSLQIKNKTTYVQKSEIENGGQFLDVGKLHISPCMTDTSNRVTCLIIYRQETFFNQLIFIFVVTSTTF